MGLFCFPFPHPFQHTARVHTPFLDREAPDFTSAATKVAPTVCQSQLALPLPRPASGCYRVRRSRGNFVSSRLVLPFLLLAKGLQSGRTRLDPKVGLGCCQGAPLCKPPPVTTMECRRIAPGRFRPAKMFVTTVRVSDTRKARVLEDKVCWKTKS